MNANVISPNRQVRIQTAWKIKTISNKTGGKTFHTFPLTSLQRISTESLHAHRFSDYYNISYAQYVLTDVKKYCYVLIKLAVIICNIAKENNNKIILGHVS